MPWLGDLWTKSSIKYVVLTLGQLDTNLVPVHRMPTNFGPLSLKFQSLLCSVNLTWAPTSMCGTHTHTHTTSSREFWRASECKRFWGGGIIALHPWVVIWMRGFPEGRITHLCYMEHHMCTTTYKQVHPLYHVCTMNEGCTTRHGLSGAWLARYHQNSRSACPFWPEEWTILSWNHNCKPRVLR
jgi:hypothetical protein